MNIRSMLVREPDNPALEKYARLGGLLCQERFQTQESAWEALIEFLSDLTIRLQLPKLSGFGLEADGLDHVVAHSRGSSMNTNPIVLSDEEIKTILMRRL